MLNPQYRKCPGPSGSGSLMLAAAVLLLTACVTQHVGSDYDRSATFSGFHRFVWLPREQHGSQNPLIVQRAHDAIEAELTRQGFVHVEDPSAADFAVDFTIGAHERIDVQSYPGPDIIPYAGADAQWWGYRYWGNQIDVRKYREGILAIDVFDAHSRRPVWHGWARKELTRSDIERSEAPIRKAVQDVLKDFPPGV